MTLEADERVFRRRLKRRLLLWRIAALLALAGLAVLALQREGRLPRVDHIARLDVTGIILENSDRTEALRETAEDPSVKALIVHINSPGGTVVGGAGIGMWVGCTGAIRRSDVRASNSGTAVARCATSSRRSSSSTER